MREKESERERGEREGVRVSECKGRGRERKGVEAHARACACVYHDAAIELVPAKVVEPHGHQRHQGGAPLPCDSAQGHHAHARFER